MPTFKASNITSFDAIPKVARSARLNKGRSNTILDTIETQAIIAVGDIILIARVPVEAALISVKIASDDLGTTGDFDIGFYRGTHTDGTAGVVLDANALATAIDMNLASLTFTDYRYDTLGIETVQQPVWDLATLSARPSYDFIDIALTATEATTSIGTISCIVEYVDAVG